MPAEGRPPRVAVIGAGIGGLACAHCLLEARPDLDVTLYEATGSVGGKLRLGEVAGVPVDLGAESMLNRRPEATWLASAVGLAEAVTFPSVAGAGVWTRRAIRALPQTLMGIPAHPRAAGRSGIISRFGAARAALEPMLPSPDLTEDVGIGRLVASRLGTEVRDRLVEPLLGGVYAGRATELSLHATLPGLVASVAEHGSLVAAARASAAVNSGSSDSPVFAGISGGVARLPPAVARWLRARGAHVQVDTPVRAVDRTPDGWRLATGSTRQARTIDVDAVALALPAAPAARLLRAEAPVAARELAGIEYASVALVTLALDAARIDVALDGSGFLVPPVEGHTIKAATYSSRKWGWQSDAPMLIRCSIGRHREEADLQRDDGELVDAAVCDLREAIGLRTPLVDSCVTRWGGALPQYAVGHLGRVETIRSAVACLPRMEVCGAAYDGVGIPAVIASGRAAATRLLDQLGREATITV